MGTFKVAALISLFKHGKGAVMFWTFLIVVFVTPYALEFAMNWSEIDKRRRGGK